jgi:DNA-binding XRE family transcriptional regulator
MSKEPIVFTLFGSEIEVDPDDEARIAVFTQLAADEKAALAHTKTVPKDIDLAQAKHRLLTELLTARNKKKLSQTELAERAGIAQSAYARIESGKGNPTLETLLKIAEQLDVRLALQTTS